MVQRKEMRKCDVAVTGIGLVTPLGCNPGEILSAISKGRTAHQKPSGFDPSGFLCPVAGEVHDRCIDELVKDRKEARLMGRDALLAVAAARLALQDSGIVFGRDCSPEDVALVGATGMAGLPFGEIEALVRASADDHGWFDLRLFGEKGLRVTRPVISFKILNNMPLCFVSIFEGIQGTNLIFNPWEGQGALAIWEGIRCIERGEARLAVAGGCDCKSHNLAFVTLQQYGMFDSWRRSGTGMVPGEGAGFLVLERASVARKRKACIYCLFRRVGHASDLDAMTGYTSRWHPLAEAMENGMRDAETRPGIVFSGVDGDIAGDAVENEALERVGLARLPSIAVKLHVTNLFAAAAVTNVGLAAYALSSGAFAGAARGRSSPAAIVNCFGPGTEKVSFLLGAA